MPLIQITLLHNIPTMSKYSDTRQVARSNIQRSRSIEKVSLRSNPIKVFHEKEQKCTSSFFVKFWIPVSHSPENKTVRDLRFLNMVYIHDLGKTEVWRQTQSAMRVCVYMNHYYFTLKYFLCQHAVNMAIWTGFCSEGGRRRKKGEYCTPYWISAKLIEDRSNQKPFVM